MKLQNFFNTGDLKFGQNEIAADKQFAPKPEKLNSVISINPPK
jgi:hypothetical protein